MKPAAIPSLLALLLLTASPAFANAPTTAGTMPSAGAEKADLSALLGGDAKGDKSLAAADMPPEPPDMEQLQQIHKYAGGGEEPAAPATAATSGLKKQTGAP